jgi:hypothetical protein
MYTPKQPNQSIKKAHRTGHGEISLFVNAAEDL